MAKNHALIHSSSVVAMNVDAMNLCGIATVDLDNGVLVKLGNINKTDDNDIQGFEFNVEAAGAEDKNLWIVDSPEVGYSLEMQLYHDPRYFYNVAGKGMSIKYLTKKVDHIEVNAEAFASAELPEDGFATVGDGGKLVAAASEPTADVTYFSVVGKHSIQIGMESVPTVILRCENN